MTTTTSSPAETSVMSAMKFASLVPVVMTTFFASPPEWNPATRARRLAPDSLGVSELRAHQLLLITRDLLERQRLDPRLGEVVLHPVLPGGLHALHVEGGELHRHSVQSGISASRRQRVAAPPASGRTRGRTCARRSRSARSPLWRRPRSRSGRGPSA